MTGRIGRRHLIGCAGAAMLIPASPLFAGRRGTSDAAIVAWGDAERGPARAAFGEALHKESGIQVVEVATRTSLAAAKEGGWDVMSVDSRLMIELESHRLLAALPRDLCDPGDLIEKRWYRSHAMGWYCDVLGIGHALEDRRLKSRHPKDWTQFWDGARFPGGRGLRPRPEETLEAALLASGVKPGKVYPMDLGRAFASLDRLRPHLTMWIKAAPRAIGLIESGAVSYLPARASRVATAQRRGRPVGIATGSPLLVPRFLVVAKESPNRDAAFRLLRHVMAADRQRAWALARPGVVPLSRRAWRKLPKARRDGLPNPRDSKVLFTDIDWWSANGNAAQKRFREWLLT